jgi:large subunit ribosomal protein L22e
MVATAKKIDPASAKSKNAKDAKKVVPKKQALRGKNLKKKKEHLRYGVDCTNIAEDNILDVADFVSSHVNNKF